MGIRRVVTGHDQNGKAVVIFDGEAENVSRPPARAGLAIHNFWWQEGTPAPLAGNAETTDREIGLLPPKNGSIFRIIEYPPDKNWIGKMGAEGAAADFAHMGAAHVQDRSATRRHPGMHKTETLDYAVILKGEIVMLLDEEEVALSAGDVVVQRGTNHAWNNRSDESCWIMFVLIDGSFDS